MLNSEAKLPIDKPEGDSKGPPEFMAITVRP